MRFCERTLEVKHAEISIDIESGDANKDIERTLLHELLHIVTYEYQWAVDTCLGNAEEKIANMLTMKLEQLVEGLAKSFVALGGNQQENIKEE